MKPIALRIRSFAATLCFGAALCLATHISPAQAADRDAAIKPTEVIKLFDGKTAGDCYTFLQDTQRADPRRVFRVTNGQLHVTGDGLGSIITNKEYRDYHLVLEFKWGEKTYRDRQSKTKDTGLLIHSQGADGGYNGIWMPSFEVQIIEGGMGDFILVNGKGTDGEPVPLSLTCEVARDRDGEVVWKQGGNRETFNLKNRKRINWFGRDPDWADRLGFRGKDDLDKSQTQWTRFDVLCDGGHIQTYVNGTLVNEAFDASPSYGRIQLQSELAEAFFRRWELHPLGQGPKPGPAE